MSYMFKTILYSTNKRRTNDPPAMTTAIDEAAVVHQSPPQQHNVEGGHLQQAADNLVSVPPVGMVVVSKPLSYANVADTDHAARLNIIPGGGAKGGNTNVSYDNNDDDDDDNLSLHTVSSESVDLPFQFNLQQAKRDDVKGGSIHNDATHNIIAYEPSSRSPSPPQAELSLRVSQVTAMSQLEVDSIENDYVGLDISAASSSRKATPPPPCDDSEQAWASEGPQGSTKDGVSKFEAFEQQDQQHNLDTLVNVGIRMQDEEVAATHGPAPTKAKTYSTAFKLGIAFTLILAAAAAGRLFPLQDGDVSSSFRQQSIDKVEGDAPHMTERTLVATTANWTVDSFAVVTPESSFGAFVGGGDEDPLVAAQKAIEVFIALWTTTTVHPSRSAADATTTSFQEEAHFHTRTASGWLVMVALAIMVVNLRAEAPSRLTPECCESDGAIHPSGADQDRPQNPRIKVEPTHWMTPINNHDDLDLSAYESMKVSELRRLLRARKCNADGTKDILVRRLVTVYQAELATLTVQQLRPKLRSRGCKQSGKKIDLIRRLIVVGL